MKIKKGLVLQIMKVLIHNVGDTRHCPVCMHDHILKDECTKESWIMYQELEKLIKEKK